jgi:hypothetical protein
MITDASWSDIDGDHDPDLLLVGEVHSCQSAHHESGKFTEKALESGFKKLKAWRIALKEKICDGDGDIDFVVGNHGLNSRFRASVTKPVCLYVSDFDHNGTIEQIICSYVGDRSYPMVLRHDLVSQFPALKKKYLKYENFKDETITDIFYPEQMKEDNSVELHMN